MGAKVDAVSECDGIHKNGMIDARLGSHLDERNIKAVLHQIIIYMPLGFIEGIVL
jgi:hypothetical protein